MKVIKYISVFAISLLVCGFLLGFAMNRSSEARCEGVDITVLGDPTVRFVTQQSLTEFIHLHGHTFNGERMKDIDTYGIEVDINSIPFVDRVVVYKTIDRRVSIAVEQRIPVLRIFFEDGSSNYVDSEARIMELSDSYSYKCLPVTGLKPLEPNTSVIEKSNSDLELYTLWQMANFIASDEFWNAQIIQVDIDEKKGAVLIPRVGNHEIILGSTKDYNVKLRKLKEFYDKGIKQTNWNIYHSLDLRYEGQVVAVKR